MTICKKRRVIIIAAISVILLVVMAPIIQLHQLDAFIDYNAQHDNFYIRHSASHTAMFDTHPKYVPTKDSCFQPHPYFRPSKTQQINYPLINLGFPKAGTTTVQKFFECGNPNLTVSHQFCKYGVTSEAPVDHNDFPSPHNNNNRGTRMQQSQQNGYCGKCFYDAVFEPLSTTLTTAGKNEQVGPSKRIKKTATPNSPLQYCGNYDVYTQLDMTNWTNGECYWPQIDLLDEIHQSNPYATFLFTMRNFTNWYKSLLSWSHFDIRLARCQLDTYYPHAIHVQNRTIGTTNNDKSSFKIHKKINVTEFKAKKHFQNQLNKQLQKKSIQTFYCDQVERVRNFVLKYPTHTLIEIDAESDLTIGQQMSSIFDIHESCWTRTNANPQIHTNLTELETTKVTLPQQLQKNSLKKKQKRATP